MPNPIPLNTVITRLPSFVTIFPDTYKGVRYKARFLDTEYNEEFEHTVIDVIRLQSGCRSRSNDLRSKNARHSKLPVPLEEVLSKIPSHLEMDISTYRGVRYKAKFYDSEFNEHFEMLVANVIRDGRGYCKARRLREFNKAIALSRDDIEKRLQELYAGRIKYVEGYKDTKGVSTWNVDGRNVRMSNTHVLYGMAFDRQDKDRLKMAVLVRDWFTCQKCGTTDSPHCHHILVETKFPDERFNINNGLVLCSRCHALFHSKYKFVPTKENFFLWLDNPELQNTIETRLSEPRLEAPKVNPYTLRFKPPESQSLEPYSRAQSIAPEIAPIEGSL